MLEMEETESMDTFATCVNKMVVSIRALGDEWKDLTVVKKVLQAAPARFMHLVTSLEQCIDLKMLTGEDLFERFQTHEERVRMRFGDPVGGNICCCPRNNGGHIGRVIVVQSAVMSTTVSMRMRAATPTPVCVVGAS